MDYIEEKEEILKCSVINKKVTVMFHSILFEGKIIGPPHMRGCSAINDCGVVTVDMKGIQTNTWANCPVYQQYP